MWDTYDVAARGGARVCADDNAILELDCHDRGLSRGYYQLAFRILHRNIEAYTEVNLARLHACNIDRLHVVRWDVGYAQVEMGLEEDERRCTSRGWLKG